MANTKIQLREWLIGLCGVYNVPLANVQNRILDMCVEWGINHVFWNIFAANKNKFLREATVAQNGNYPAQHLRFAGAANYTDGGSVVRTFRYAEVPELPAAKKSIRLKAETFDPVISFYDHKVHYLPTGIASANYEYYFYPKPLGDTSIADNTDDEMPPGYLEVQGRAALQKLLILLTSQGEEFGLLQFQIESMKGTLGRLYDEIFAVTEVDTRKE